MNNDDICLFQGHTQVRVLIADPRDTHAYICEFYNGNIFSTTIGQLKFLYSGGWSF